MARTNYEWVVEFLDEHGDIEDCAYWDTYAEARAYAQSGKRMSPVRIGLKRDCGDLQRGRFDRLYAYESDGQLPEYFEEYEGKLSAQKVPQRFQFEIDRFNRTQQ